MSDALPRPSYVPNDHLTPARDITHGHFAPGDHVLILKGVSAGSLRGTPVRVITESWHTPTEENGWRLRDPEGGQRSYFTAHPRYLIHLSRYCGDCLIYLRAMEDTLLPKLPRKGGPFDCGWYTTTALGQLVHIADVRGGR